MKKRKKVIIFGTIVIMMLAFTGCGKTTVKLNKYITITTDGYDSMGTATYVFDYDAFEEDYSGKIKASKDSNKLNGWGLLSGETSEELLLDFCVNQKLDKTSGLSNGDVVTLEWNCEDTMAEEYFNVKLDYSDIKYTVKNLEEVEKFDPFEYVTISFSGMSPNGTVTITPDYNRTEMQYIKFSADKNNGLKNGDSITVTASISGLTESFVEKFGAVIGKKEEVYTVDGLSRYISDISDISEDMYNKMDKQLQDVFNSQVASSWENKNAVQDFGLVCNYLLTLKEGMIGNSYNTLYYVYKVTAETHDGPFTYFWYGYYKDIKILADGSCTVDLSQYVACDCYRSWGYTSGDYLECDSQHYYVAGVADLDTFFNQHIASKIDRYEYTQISK